MKRIFIVLAIACMAMLSGCDFGGSYTDELKQEYEDDVLAAVEARLSDEGLEGLQAELYAPGGLTRTCIGRFRKDGEVAQYVYDSVSDVLYASSTKYGYSLLDAKEDAADEIRSYLDGTGVQLESVRSMSWPLAVDEYFYTVSVEDGEKKVSGSGPRVGVRWIACPYFDYTLTDREARQFVSGVLHGFSDGFNGISVALRCQDFDDPTVQAELLSDWNFLKVFSGVDTVLLYEDSSDDAYYKFSRNSDGTVLLELYERQVTSKSGGTWRRTVCTTPGT